MKATIYDIAREAGVSIATVSQVINGKGKISEKRRAEVMEIMERLNYQPSAIAAALTGKQTYTLGLLVPDISNPYFAELARAIEDRSRQLGYSVVICSTDNKDERVERYLNLLQQKRVDGMMIGTGIDNAEILSPLLQQSIPVALIARQLPSLSVHTVSIDDRLGGALAAEHLLQLGHTRFGVVSEPLKVSSSKERVRGFREAVEEAGLALESSQVRESTADIQSAKQEVLVLLEQTNRPTGIFCCNDMQAIGALQAAKELGLQVPEDVSIVGFDNTILASVTNPPLTTVAQPIEDLGHRAVDLLIDELKDEHKRPQKLVLKPELVIRESTGDVSIRS
ncbi:MULTISPECIES: LacI family DNA-binding transcriptional regulator [Paenibacillus]|uniref:LacI family DNA-binding transcriptional regulator n=1 Tax=Paenibacillus TaxID=44249 RepID=UPI00187B27E6|nr:MULTISPECIES: LacI family DNA-binding transcriptional regulator [Paenibacillus]MBE7684411.1 substrate-binding domain-containing protein [Paenibacillus sp. P13VS]MBY0220679.1 LacI family DNA-binding transcriptional regulator [Paenibacillus illinoisensis]